MDFQMPVAGQVVAWLFGLIDSILTEQVGRVAENATTLATPFVGLFLWLSFTWQALMIMRGKSQQPVMEFLERSLQIGIVVSLALPGGMYMTDIIEILLTAPVEFAVSLIGGTPHGESAEAYFTELFDVSLSGAATLGSNLFSSVGLMGPVKALVAGLITLIMVLAIAALVILGVIIIALVKMAVGILAAVGPLFLFAFLFDYSRDMGKRWVAMLMNFFLLMGFFAIVAGLLLRTLAGWVLHLAQSLTEAPENLLSHALALLVVTATSFVILYMIPGWASTLTGSFGSNIGSAAGQAGRLASQGAFMAKSAALRFLR